MGTVPWTVYAPTRSAVQGLQRAVRRILEAHRGESAWTLIRHLNQTLRGWCTYHRHACSSHIFRWIDSWLFYAIKRWLRRRHPNKGRHWIMKRYYCRYHGRAWTFHETRRNRAGKLESRYLHRADHTRIVRHVKIRSDANPYDPAWTGYFIDRRRKRRMDNRDGRFVEETGWLSDRSRL